MERILTDSSSNCSVTDISRFCIWVFMLYGSDEAADCLFVYNLQEVNGGINVFLIIKTAIIMIV